jgi:hypothetical protein
LDLTLLDPQRQLSAELYSVLDELYKKPSVTLVLQCLLPFAVVGRWFAVPPEPPLFFKEVSCSKLFSSLTFMKIRRRE